MISGLSHNNNSFRTCYPTGSADVGNCFIDLPQGKTDGIYITSVHVGGKSCPWDNGGIRLLEVMKQQKQKQINIWGIVNRAKGDDLPNWKDAVNCMCLDGKCNDDRKDYFLVY